MLRKSEIIRRYLVIVFLILMFGLLMGSVTWFSSSLQKLVTKTTYSFLQQTAKHQASTFHTKLDDQLKMLESIVLEFQDVDFNNYNQLKRTILSTSEIGEFKEILVSDANGIALCNNNTMAGNLSQKDYFKSAMLGNLAISDGLNVDDEGEDVLALSVPIYQQEQVCGVLTGTFNREVLNELFNMETFDGAGYNYIIDTNGNIIVDGGALKLLESGNNFFAYLRSFVTDSGYKEFVNNLKKGNSGIVSYRIGADEKLAAYQPIGIYDWYVISVVPKNVISVQNQSIRWIVLELICVLTICFIATLLLVIHYKRKIKRLANLSDKKQDMFSLSVGEKKTGKDTLTGIQNRTAFWNKVTEMLATKEDDSACCLFLIEVNSLTQINKHHGYAYGDKLLKNTARQLERVFYFDDIIGRVDGDTFGICMSIKPSFPYEKVSSLAKKKAKKIVVSMEKLYEEQQDYVNVHIGIAIGRGQSISCEQLKEVAVETLKKSKKEENKIEIPIGEIV